MKRNKKSTIHQPEDNGGTVIVASIHSGDVSAFFCYSMIGTLLYDQNRSRRIVGMMQEWSSANVSAGYCPTRTVETVSSGCLTNW